MNHVSLFSGIGGADLAAVWAGIETVAHSEIDPYCCKVLAKNFPGVPNLGDIHQITKESFYDATGHTTADIISGGFPCQPFSVAGKQRGKEDDRYLWPQMLRVVTELKPSWVIGENVAGFIKMGLDDALSDLETAGYECRAFVLPACSVGAMHSRKRVFIVAHTDGKRVERRGQKPIQRELNIQGRQVGECFSEIERRFDTPESRLCRSLHGIPNGVDRIRALGNAIVPQVIYPIFQAIYDIEGDK